MITPWQWGTLRGPGRRGDLQLRCFLMTYIAQASIFFLIKPLGVIKHDLYEGITGQSRSFFVCVRVRFAFIDTTHSLTHQLTHH